MTSATSKLSAGGRIVIPAKLRKALSLEEGDEVVLTLEEGEIRLSTRRQRLKKSQATVRRYVSAERSLSEELIAERRVEAKHE